MGEKAVYTMGIRPRREIATISKSRRKQKIGSNTFLRTGWYLCFFLTLIILKSSSLKGDLTELLVLAAYASLCFIIATNYLKKWKTAKLLKEKRKSNRKKRNVCNQINNVVSVCFNYLALGASVFPIIHIQATIIELRLMFKTTD
jgi:uncharacterized membrane protein